MKKFAVLKRIGAFGATVVREFKDTHPWVALDFAHNLQISEDNPDIEYYVAETYTVDEWGKVCNERFASPSA
jgi:hypothetical protein